MPRFKEYLTEFQNVVLISPLFHQLLRKTVHYQLSSRYQNEAYYYPRWRRPCRVFTKETSTPTDHIFLCAVHNFGTVPACEHDSSLSPSCQLRISEFMKIAALLYPIILPHPHHCFAFYKHTYLPKDVCGFHYSRHDYRSALLVPSGIEPNPGPRKPYFPCGICGTACWTDSLGFGECDQWIHKVCICMSSTELSRLNKTVQMIGSAQTVKPLTSLR